MNKVFLIGNLTRDPELTTVPGGVSVCRFGLAVSRTRGGERQTDFFNVTAWRALGERVAQYMKKGSKAAVIGSIELREYTDNQGNKRMSADVIADEVEFLTRGAPHGDGEQAMAASRAYPPQPSAASRKKPVLQEIGDDADIPF